MLRVFGTWAAALAAAEVRSNSPRTRQSWSRERIVERLQAWAQLHGGRGPASNDWRRGGHPDWRRGEWPNGNSVLMRFGGWAEALEAACVLPRPRRRIGGSWGRWTPELCLQRLRDWAATHGGHGPLSTEWEAGRGHADWQEGEWPSASVVIFHFGTWNRAHEVAAVAPHPRHRVRGSWSRERIVERLQAWAQLHGGRGPASNDWRRGGHPDWCRDEWPHRLMVARSFGTWEQALAAAGVAQRPRASRAPRQPAS